jgi:predicted TIM-barrel fold metal-dependent hydrolase
MRTTRRTFLRQTLVTAATAAGVLRCSVGPEPPKKSRVINVHEHIQSLEQAKVFISAMDKMEVDRVSLLGSSWFTITMRDEVGFTRYDENNVELMKIVREYPGRFDAWPVMNPLDDNKLDKFRRLMDDGATGLKLFTGHGYLTKKNEYIFHPIAMDDPRMMPVYDHCEKSGIPVLIHVNPSPVKPGFCEEFVAVLRQFPDMVVNCPHFMLSSIKDSRLREFLDVFPNLYTDISFGDAFMKAGLMRISKDPGKFSKLFADYADRFMFGTDLVLTEARHKSEEWVHNQFRAYIDMLSSETYTTPCIPGESLRGLALTKDLLDGVLFRNYENFLKKKPKGTTLARAVDFKRMGVTPTGRQAGQVFPPPANKRDNGNTGEISS